MHKKRFSFIKENYNKQILVFIYVLSFYTLIGKSLATFFNKPMKLWDITATLPICKNIAMSFKNLKTGETVENLKDLSIDENWYLNDGYLMCNDKLFSKIKEELEINR